MFYFLDEPIGYFTENPTGGLSNTAIIAIILSLLVVIAVAVLITVIIKKGGKKWY